MDGATVRVIGDEHAVIIQADGTKSAVRHSMAELPAPHAPMLSRSSTMGRRPRYDTAADLAAIEKEIFRTTAAKKRERK